MEAQVPQQGLLMLTPRRKKSVNKKEKGRKKVETLAVDTDLALHRKTAKTDHLR